ncbi:MAG: hypothetical protein NC324_02350 [Bacteroides sp.]|nr:hypothetical protein [Bacteroides sp.]
MKAWVELLVGFVVGGGLVILATLPSIIRKKKIQVALDEFNFCKEHIAWLEENLHKEMEMMQVMCSDCCYKEFYKNSLNRLNNRINEKATKQG